MGTWEAGRLAGNARVREHSQAQFLLSLSISCGSHRSKTLRQHCELQALVCKLASLYEYMFICSKSLQDCVFAIGKPERQCAKFHTVAASNILKITCHDHCIIACSRHIYMGVVLRTHPVNGESHIQGNDSGGCNSVII